MNFIKLLYVLYKIKLCSPRSLWFLLISIIKHGTNLMALLAFAAKKYKHQILLIDDDNTYTYNQLFEDSIRLAYSLKVKMNIGNRKKVAIMCKNHAALVKSMFAVSRLGADLYFIHTEITSSQLKAILTRHDFYLIIFDDELKDKIKKCNFNGFKIRSYHSTLPAISNNLLIDSQVDHFDSIPRTAHSKIVLHTSGTTGFSKEAEHYPSLFTYLNPFIAFIKRLQILKYKTAYIATPIYHGYGMAVLLLFLPLGKKLIVTKDFNVIHAGRIIRDHKVEVVNVVPTILHKLLQLPKDDLKTLKCIASGGAPLNKQLVELTFQQLGEVLYNLYGTTEAGLNFIATSKDLLNYPTTVGKPIKGVQIKILDTNKNQVNDGKVGQIYVRNQWSMGNRKNEWIPTGDLGHRDSYGYYYLNGRADDMVISGGVNVYPLEVENIILKHPEVVDVAVIGVKDNYFGQRLKAYILLNENSKVTENELREWLKLKLARFQMPRDIEFVDKLPYSHLGKLDKKQLTN